MFEKTSRLAEKVAANVSRRHFFGSVGRWAGATALSMAGVLTVTSRAHGGPEFSCCHYTCSPNGCGLTTCVSGPCPSFLGLPNGGCTLGGSSLVGNCNKCTKTKGIPTC